jgi:outer membrane biosynthesis protein TonB
MSAVALPYGAARHDAARWGICFAIAVAAHVAIALSFLLKPSPDDDYGVDAPVVMLELPESFVISTAPPTDLAPGRKQEESEATPPPKEETKPPEQQAEVALPEPPKPEPPQEQRQATAPPAAAPSVAVVHRWETELVAISSVSSTTRPRHALAATRAWPGWPSPSIAMAGYGEPASCKARDQSNWTAKRSPC